MFVYIWHNGIKKPQPNDRNISMQPIATLLAQYLQARLNSRNILVQHIATLLGAICCVHLATFLQQVGCCKLN